MKYFQYLIPEFNDTHSIYPDISDRCCPDNILISSAIEIDIFRRESPPIIRKAAKLQVIIFRMSPTLIWKEVRSSFIFSLRARCRNAMLLRRIAAPKDIQKLSCALLNHFVLFNFAGAPLSGGNHPARQQTKYSFPRLNNLPDTTRFIKPFKVTQYWPTIRLVFLVRRWKIIFCCSRSNRRRQWGWMAASSFLMLR